MTENIGAIDWSIIKVISFDLDDTLWDNSGVIEKCQLELFNYLSEQHPPIKRHFTVDSMERIAEQFFNKEDSSFDNMTLLRKAVIRQMLEETDGDIRLINPAFAIFYYWRNQVKIPEKTVKVLEYLGDKHLLVATSNGNSNLSKIGLMKYFQAHYIAGIHGKAKPSPDMLNKLVEKYAIEPKELLHIGDSYSSDIQSAINAKVQRLEIHVSNIDKLLDV